jgi:hypothetical protein
VVKEILLADGARCVAIVVLVLCPIRAAVCHAEIVGTRDWNIVALAAVDAARGWVLIIVNLRVSALEAAACSTLRRVLIDVADKAVCRGVVVVVNAAGVTEMCRAGPDGACRRV